LWTLKTKPSVSFWSLRMMADDTGGVVRLQTPSRRIRR
jgi:hypothetical protein